MPSYQHETLLNEISRLNREPSDDVSFERWITAKCLKNRLMRSLTH